MKLLFNPRSVAVIGASHSEDKVGYKVVHNIIAGGYTGKIYPVNPRGGELLGQKVYPDIDSIPGDIDVAAIVIPSGQVLDAISQCARKKVKYAVVITSGFSEVGRTAEEQELVRVARENGMRVLGPNILGYYAAAGSLNLTFGPPKVLSGEVAIISQSGALGIALMGKTVVDNLRLSAFFSIGNKADLDESDLLDYLADDENTKVVLIYMEGVKNGEGLIRALRKTTRKKPVIMVKAGGSRKGARAAASHTGALAGSDEVFAAVMKQCNVLRAESLSEALDWCYFFANTPLPRGENTVIVTNGGGLGVMATDAAEKFSVQLYDCQDDLQKTFSPYVPPFGSLKNPVDITAGQDHDTYDRALGAVLDNPAMHALVVIYCQVAVCDINRLREVVAARARQFQAAAKPILFAPVGNELVNEAMAWLRQNNVPVMEDPYRAVSCLGAMYRYFRALEPAGSRVEPAPLTLIDAEEINRLVKAAAGEKRGFLLADECGRLLEAAGIARPSAALAVDPETAVAAAGKIGFPVVMKVVSPDILHKSDAGGVLLGLEDDEQVRAGFGRVRDNCLRYNPKARFQGVEISEMLKPGLEIIVGARRDSSFGPIVMCGLGGIYVEVLKDVVFRALPLDRPQARRMVEELKAYSLLAGVRGRAPSDIDAVVETIIRAGEIIMRCPGISDIEVNPVFVYEKGLKAVDARVMLTGGEA